MAYHAQLVEWLAYNHLLLNRLQRVPARDTVMIGTWDNFRC